jgi:hypothetical protein
MSGELHDWQFPNATPVYDQRHLDAQYVLFVTIMFLAVYYLIVRPLKLFVSEESAKEVYNDSGITPPFCIWPFYSSWRELENLQ